MKRLTFLVSGLFSLLYTCSLYTQGRNSEILRGIVEPVGFPKAAVTVEIWPGLSDNSPKDRSTPPIARLLSDENGRFAMQLAAGSYSVCAYTFPKSCQTISLGHAPKAEEFVGLHVNPTEDPAGFEVLDDRIRAIAGSGAQNCGLLKAKDSRVEATRCALRAAKSRKAFFVRYAEIGVDSEGGTGAADDSGGDVYIVDFDSAALGSGNLEPGVTMPDGFHTVVYRCDRPLRVRKSITGELTCFSHGRWLAN
jgi:hypothetical protein